jgi:hypothetical protein
VIAERDCWLLTERWELVGHTWALFGVPVSRSIYLDPLHFLDAEDTAPLLDPYQ